MHDTPTQEMRMEPRRPETPVQDAEQAVFEVWSLDPRSPPHLLLRTALGILICHGLLSETVKTGTLEEFSEAAQEFLSRASRRVTTVEAFTDFSMAEVSSLGISRNISMILHPPHSKAALLTMFRMLFL
jgi:hypothetical protein